MLVDDDMFEMHPLSLLLTSSGGLSLSSGLQTWKKWLPHTRWHHGGCSSGSCGSGSERDVIDWIIVGLPDDGTTGGGPRTLVTLRRGTSKGVKGAKAKNIWRAGTVRIKIAIRVAWVNNLDNIYNKVNIRKLGFIGGTFYNNMVNDLIISESHVVAIWAISLNTIN